jgi:uncharacterized membrane protein
MNKMFKKLGLIAVSMLVIDLIVLNLLSKMWTQTIEKVQNIPFKVKPLYAVGAYVLMIFGLYYFVLEANIPADQLVLKAFVFGIVVYGIFDFTNLAIFTNYDLKTGIIDILWGGILMVLVTWIVKKIET